MSIILAFFVFHFCSPLFFSIRGLILPFIAVFCLYFSRFRKNTYTLFIYVPQTSCSSFIFFFSDRSYAFFHSFTYVLWFFPVCFVFVFLGFFGGGCYLFSLPPSLTRLLARWDFLREDTTTETGWNAFFAGVTPYPFPPLFKRRTKYKLSK